MDCKIFRKKSQDCVVLSTTKSLYRANIALFSKQWWNRQNFQVLELHSLGKYICNLTSNVAYLLLLDFWVLIYFLPKKANRTGVINDPPGQTHSLIYSEHCFLLFCSARFEKWVCTYKRMDRQYVRKQWSQYIPWLWFGLVDQYKEDALFTPVWKKVYQLYTCPIFYSRAGMENNSMETRLKYILSYFSFAKNYELLCNWATPESIG